MTTPIGKGLVEVLTSMAHDLAKKHDLVSDRGRIICWRCRDEEALLPSLHCPRCLQAARSRRGQRPQIVNVRQEKARDAG